MFSVRRRNQLRILLGRHPAQMRGWWPDVELVGLRHGDNVIDAGAHVGDFALCVLAHQPWAKIHAFEPLPKPFAVLQSRLRAFGDTWCHQMALGSSEGEQDLLQSKFAEASSFLPNAELLN